MALNAYKIAYIVAIFVLYRCWILIVVVVLEELIVVRKLDCAMEEMTAAVQKSKRTSTHQLVSAMWKYCRTLRFNTFLDTFRLFCFRIWKFSMRCHSQSTSYLFSAGRIKNGLCVGEWVREGAYLLAFHLFFPRYIPFPCFVS